MTALKYLMASGACKTAEILKLKKDAPKDFYTLIEWTKEEMKHNGIEIDAPIS